MSSSGSVITQKTERWKRRRKIIIYLSLPPFWPIFMFSCSWTWRRHMTVKTVKHHRPLFVILYWWKKTLFLSFQCATLTNMCNNQSLKLLLCPLHCRKKTNHAWQFNTQTFQSADYSELCNGRNRNEQKTFQSTDWSELCKCNGRNRKEEEKRQRVIEAWHTWQTSANNWCGRMKRRELRRKAKMYVLCQTHQQG